jgi:hypothetical protein
MCFFELFFIFYSHVQQFESPINKIIEKLHNFSKYRMDEISNTCSFRFRKKHDYNLNRINCLSHHIVNEACSMNNKRRLKAAQITLQTLSLISVVKLFPFQL